MASEDTGGAHGRPPCSARQMCLLEKREANISPLNMTLAARLYPQCKFLLLSFSYSYKGSILHVYFRIYLFEVIIILEFDLIEALLKF